MQDVSCPSCKDLLDNAVYQIETGKLSKIWVFSRCLRCRTQDEDFRVTKCWPDVLSGKAKPRLPSGGKIPGAGKVHPPILSWSSERNDFIAGSVAHLHRRKTADFANYQAVSTFGVAGQWSPHMFQNEEECPLSGRMTCMRVRD
jgi:hypothetical protein